MEIKCAILPRNMASVSHKGRWVLSAKINLGTPVAMPGTMPGKVLTINMKQAFFDAINYQIHSICITNGIMDIFWDIEISGFGCA